MICPNCGKQSAGKWCAYCGTALENIQSEYNETNYENTIKQEEPPLKNSNGSQWDLNSGNAQSGNAYWEQNGNDPLYSNSSNNSVPPDYNAYPTPNGYSNTPGEDYPDFDALDKIAFQKKMKITLAIVCPIVAILAAAAILFACGVFDAPKEDIAKKPVHTETESTKEKFRALQEKALKFVDSGDYESAEEIYKQIIDEGCEEDEVAALYKIVYNYNRAKSKLNSSHYNEARNYYSKIPEDYNDYSISSDVEQLGSEIARYEDAHNQLSIISEYLAKQDYDTARTTISELDINYLSDADKKMLDKYTSELSDAASSEQEDNITENEAFELLNSYCEAMVKAINEGDFSIVEPYLLSGSPLYSQQKKLVQSLYTSGVTEKFDSVTIVKLTHTSSTVCQATVKEKETVYHADGSADANTYSWIYTIERSNGDWYLTQIARA